MSDLNNRTEMYMQQGKWIPVAEQLPEKGVDVTCRTDAGEIFTASYVGKDDGSEFISCFLDYLLDNGMIREGNIVAWMQGEKDE